MKFQIHALPESLVSGLEDLSDKELAERNMQRVTADAARGFPCRISLQDAAMGETLYLMNFTHLDEDTPYRASHAIFVRAQAKECHPAVNHLPEVLTSRLLSLRAFDAGHRMITADLAQGDEIAPMLGEMFACPAIAYIHLHNARPGCYAARATRAKTHPNS